MAWFHGNYIRIWEQGRTVQDQIAHHIEQFMLGNLVVGTQRRRESVRVDHKHVVERASASEASGEERVHLFGEAEGPSARDMLGVVLAVVRAEARDLGPDQCVRKMDGHRDPETIRGIGGDKPAVSARHDDRALQSASLYRPPAGETRFAEGIHPARRTAVADRDLRAVDLDGKINYPKARAGREEVFYGRQARGSVAEDRATRRIYNPIGASRQYPAAREVKDDSAARVARSELDVRNGAGMETGAAE